ncbi:hypothetical protein NDU88_008698 [Pleurodeles waltl]|uniref:Uncharacterized protein n=1 Tax=Pleurodeles waltl TaxID=8319 RepID=A0AAV7N9V1_PLEWA|nr:hypothetical protein NDU88_008698 [Pleurodeles waltl]
MVTDGGVILEPAYFAHIGIIARTERWRAGHTGQGRRLFYQPRAHPSSEGIQDVYGELRVVQSARFRLAQLFDSEAHSASQRDRATRQGATSIPRARRESLV